MALSDLPAELRQKIIMHVLKFNRDEVLSHPDWVSGAEITFESLIVDIGFTSKILKDDVIAVVQMRKRELEDELEILRVADRIMEDEVKARLLKNSAMDDNDRYQEVVSDTLDENPNHDPGLLSRIEAELDDLLCQGNDLRRFDGLPELSRDDDRSWCICDSCVDAGPLGDWFREQANSRGSQ